MGSPITVSGYAVQAQCEIAAKHVEAVLRATLADFHDQVRLLALTRNRVILDASPTA
jgi:hypothetical protein